MSLVGLFLCILLYVPWRIAVGVQADRNRKAAARRYCPTGFALEYKTACRVYADLTARFKRQCAREGKAATVRQLKQEYAGLLPPGRLLNAQQLLETIAIVTARRECLRRGCLPRCMVSNTMALPADGQVDLRNPSLPHFPVAFTLPYSEAQYRELKVQDRMNRQRALVIRRQAGIRSGFDEDSSYTTRAKESSL